MNELEKKLSDTYSHHYTKINFNINPNTVSSTQYASMKLMYEPLIQSQAKGGIYLDIGCGTGFLLKWLSEQAGITTIGIDSSESQVKIAKSFLPDVEIVLQDGLSYLQQNERKFSGIFCTDVLEHIPDEYLLEWVEAANRSLIPGGFFYCRAPNAANLFATYSRYIDMTHKRIFTASSLVQLLEVGGLANCQTVPIRAAHLIGRMRLGLEWLLHKPLFAITGRLSETIFTSNVCAVGFQEKVN